MTAEHNEAGSALFASAMEDLCDHPCHLVYCTSSPRVLSLGLLVVGVFIRELCGRACALVCNLLLEGFDQTDEILATAQPGRRVTAADWLQLSESS